MGKIPQISLKLNLIPNALDGYGLIKGKKVALKDEILLTASPLCIKKVCHQLSPRLMIYFLVKKIPPRLESLTGRGGSTTIPRIRA